MKDQKPKTFERQFADLFKYILNRRISLVKMNFSQKSPARINSIIDKFIPYLDYRWSKLGAARFVFNHFSELRELIPSRETNVILKLENLWLSAKNILINNQKNVEKCYR